jgi:hypothetical protein
VNILGFAVVERLGTPVAEDIHRSGALFHVVDDFLTTIAALTTHRTAPVPVAAPG